MFFKHRNAVCIFYLVLRALDTVEDDMTIPINVKVPMLKTFHTNLWNAEWCFNDSKEKDKIVLENFPVVSCFCRMTVYDIKEVCFRSCYN